MNNISGNAASWTESGRAAAKASSKKEAVEIVERAEANVSDEIIELRKILGRLNEKYAVTPRKQIYDTITSVSQSILSLTEVE